MPGGKAAMIVDNSTGEIIKGIGGVGFWWQEEVDKQKFVKLYLEGVRETAGLKKPGMKVFEVVYLQVQENPNNDKVELNRYVAKEHNIEERTFRRGVRELLDKGFIYQSTAQDVFFINIRFMFNGNRLAFVRSYHLKNAATTGEDGEQRLLPLEGETIQPALPAASTSEDSAVGDES